MELNFEESRAFLHQIPKFGEPPQLILTGGDPLARADLYELTKRASLTYFRFHYSGSYLRANLGSDCSIETARSGRPGVESGWVKCGTA